MRDDQRLAAKVVQRLTLRFGAVDEAVGIDRPADRRLTVGQRLFLTELRKVRCFLGHGTEPRQNRSCAMLTADTAPMKQRRIMVRFLEIDRAIDDRGQAAAVPVG